MTLTRGTQIRIGNKYAKKMHYQIMVGRITEIRNGDGYGYYTSSDYWIHQEDCLPVELKNNKDAKILLSGEY